MTHDTHGVSKAGHVYSCYLYLTIQSARRLLPIKCRPDQCDAPLPLPAGVVALGWPSMVVHDVGASPYATARCAAFMAKRILEVDVLSRPEAAAALSAEVRREFNEWTPS